MASEKSPLLSPDQQESTIPKYGQPSTRQNDANSSSQSQLVSVPAVGLDELPPSYEASLNNGNLMISCKVCSFMIDISGKRDQHVVKCGNCNEATPIKNAPPGKKYVRCPCNCLLICKSNSERISCPRSHCKRIINLAPNPTTPSTPSVPGMCQVSCAVCHNLFLFNSLSNSLARCPHCRKVSSVGYHYARHRGRIYFIAAVLMMILSITIIVLTTSYINRYGGIYAAYICLPILSILLLARAIYFFTMKVSVIEGPL